jgi:transcription elongation GreA/GreB family factor
MWTILRMGHERQTAACDATSLADRATHDDWCYNDTTMSRAFVKDSEGDAELPEIPVSEHANHVTPSGLAALRERLAAAQATRDRLKEDAEATASAELVYAERELRWLEARIATAQLVDIERQPRDRVAFGASIDVANSDGVEATWRIVGEDEADAEHGWVSWVSPLAQALLGARVGEEVVWHRPIGDTRIEVLAIRYDG